MRGSSTRLAKWMVRPAQAVLLATLFLGGIGQAQPVAPQAEIVTLGTMAGPMANPERGQPATLLRWPDGMLLIDVGDGTVEQMARAGINGVPLRALVITHIHADHIGGLFALLTRRYQLIDPPLIIYGPPGTKAMVDGLVAAMEPLAITSPALPGASKRDPATGVTVVEISDGSSVTIEGIAVRAIANTHYMSVPAAPDPTSAQSLSLRFELPGRSVVVTGDTGPSERLTQLAQGADVLMSSVLDLDAAVAAIQASRPGAAPAFYETARAHFAQHHLSPAVAGQLAQTAGVRQLVLTHIGITPDRMAAATAELTAHWSGPFVFASDLGRY